MSERQSKRLVANLITACGCCRQVPIAEPEFPPIISVRLGEPEAITKSAPKMRGVSARIFEFAKSYHAGSNVGEIMIGNYRERL